MALFGLTAVDVTAEAAAPPLDGDETPTSGSATALPRLPGPQPDHLPATSSLNEPPTGVYLTEPPPGAATQPPPPPPSRPSQAAAAAKPTTTSPPSSPPRAGARSSRMLAPMHSPPAPPPPAPSASGRALQALSTSPPSKRLPPLRGGGGSQPTSPSRGERPSPPAGASVSPPHSRQIARDPPPDPRQFEGKDLLELVRVSTEDYNNVPRLQSVITMQLGGKTTEAAKAEALLQIRQASIINPLFSLTPEMLRLVSEHLHSRNRMLRPAAAYALAGYAANSRHGRGLLVCNAASMLPRLNAMMRCRIDSMDARYASLAIANASLHAENKEAVGRSGAIPLLISLLRQNLGRHASQGQHGEGVSPAAVGPTFSFGGGKGDGGAHTIAALLEDGPPSPPRTPPCPAALA